MKNFKGIPLIEREYRLLEELEEIFQYDIFDLNEDPMPEISSGVSKGIKIREGRIVYFSTWENKVSKIPEQIFELEKLELLDLTNNKLSIIPENISKLKSLKIIILTHNKIEKLPDSIGELQSLQALTLSENRLKRLPESIGNLKNLRLFSMYGNWYKLILPSSFWKLRKLEEIDLAETCLDRIPESIDHLRELRDLDLFNTGVKALPQTIKNLEKLQRIVLSIGRPFSKDFERLVKELKKKGVSVIT